MNMSQIYKETDLGTQPQTYQLYDSNNENLTYMSNSAKR